MAKRSKVREYDQFVVRLPEGMRDRISQAAEAAARSMNAEIVNRLQDSFDPNAISDEVAQQIEALHRCEAALERSEFARDLMGKYVDATEEVNEALRKAGRVSEQLLFQFASAVMKAAKGDRSDLDAIVEREKVEPMLGRLTTVWSIVDED